MYIICHILIINPSCKAWIPLSPWHINLHPYFKWGETDIQSQYLAKTHTAIEDQVDNNGSSGQLHKCGSREVETTEFEWNLGIFLHLWSYVLLLPGALTHSPWAQHSHYTSWPTSWCLLMCLLTALGTELPRSKCRVNTLLYFLFI